MIRTLLRLLLCIGLLVDGSGRALAAVHPHGAPPAHAATHAGAADVPPCHGDVADRADDGTRPGNAGDAAGHEGDCCRSDACRCACTPATSSMPMAASTTGVPRLLRPPVPVRRLAAHPAPALTDPLRPPIG